MVKVIINGKEHEVKGRPAEMIAWLVKRAEQIRTGSAGVRFSYRGTTLKAAIEIEETIEVV
jgi:hypothetical protein